jgi:RimJ/RimL family protein N-acetyltransferase
MELKRRLLFNVRSEDQFIFRSLHEDDVSLNYINALNLQRTYLVNNPDDLDLKWQRDYIRKIRLSKSDAICGLFRKNQLLGTSGMQSIHGEGEGVTFGIFVLDKESRGKGYGKTLVWATCYLLNALFGIRHFGAGAEAANTPSVRSFSSCGFDDIDSNQGEIKLDMDYSNFRKPGFISNIMIS